MVHRCRWPSRRRSSTRPTATRPRPSSSARAVDAGCGSRRRAARRRTRSSSGARCLDPFVAADLLLTLGDVARSRFHVPAAMLTRILELADPVATCADDRLRFEAFSACCSVYGRVDLLPEAYDGEMLGRGTTNVDFGPGIRAALAGVQDREPARPRRRAPRPSRSRRTPASAVERRVPLPSRWLRGFLEVQAIQAELAPGGRARRRRAPAPSSARSRRPRRSGRSGSRRPGEGLRIVHHDPGGGRGRPRRSRPPRACSIASPATRRRLRVFAAAGDGSTGWQLDVPGARLTLVLSPEVWRGFSGEGRALHRLADAAPAGRRRRGSRCPRLGAAARGRGARVHDRPDERATSRAPSRRSPCPGSSATTSPMAASSGASCRSISTGSNASSHGSVTRAGLSRRGAVRIDPADADGHRRLGRRRRAGSTTAFARRTTAGAARAPGTAAIAAIADRASTSSRSSSSRPMTPADELRAAAEAEDEAADPAAPGRPARGGPGRLSPVAREIVASQVKRRASTPSADLGPMLLMAYGILPVSEIRKLGWRSNHLPQEPRGGPSRDDRRSGSSRSSTSSSTTSATGRGAIVRPLVREGIVPRPDRPSYTIAMLAATRYESAAELIADDPGLARRRGLAAVRGRGRRRGQPRQPREVLRRSLGRRLPRPGRPRSGRRASGCSTSASPHWPATSPTYRAGWFSRFHESLAPTDDERARRADAYLGLLRSRVGPTVSFAVAALVRIDRAGRLPADALLGRIGPVLVEARPGRRRRVWLWSAGRVRGSADAARRAAIVADGGTCATVARCPTGRDRLIGRSVEATATPPSPAVAEPPDRASPHRSGRPRTAPGAASAAMATASRPPDASPVDAAPLPRRRARLADRPGPGDRAARRRSRSSSTSPSPSSRRRTGRRRRARPGRGRQVRRRPAGVVRPVDGTARQARPDDPRPPRQLPVQRLRPEVRRRRAPARVGRPARSRSRARSMPGWIRAPAPSCPRVRARCPKRSRRPAVRQPRRADPSRAAGSIPLVLVERLRRSSTAVDARSCRGGPPACARRREAGPRARRPPRRARAARSSATRSAGTSRSGDRRLVGRGRAGPSSGRGRPGGREAPSGPRTGRRLGRADPAIDRQAGPRRSVRGSS